MKNIYFTILPHDEHMIELKFDFNHEVLNAIRSLPSRWWDGHRKSWFVPSNQVAIDGLLLALWKTGLFSLEGNDQPVMKTTATEQKSALIARLTERLRAYHYSVHTERSYVQWIERFVDKYGNVADLAFPAKKYINEFLTNLAVKENVSASTQNQALAALLFLYRSVLDRDITDMDDIVRAKTAVRVPVVLSQQEVSSILAMLKDDIKLIVHLLYGTGMRLHECLQLRVQDIDFARHEILIRNGKGKKDRRTMLPQSVQQSLKAHLEKIRVIHNNDLDDGWERVVMSPALKKKYPRADVDWKWQWVFPQRNRWKNEEQGMEGRHHLDASIVQRAVHEASWTYCSLASMYFYTIRIKYACLPFLSSIFASLQIYKGRV